MVPIVFIQNPDSRCLTYALRCAVLSNPHKPIILLADKLRSDYRKLGVIQIHLEDHTQSSEVRLFDEIYDAVERECGDLCEMTRFMFRKWFIIHSLMTTNDISSLWAVDSETLLLADLTKQEDKFSGYPWVAQRLRGSVSGLVTSKTVLERYLAIINMSLSFDSLPTRVVPCDRCGGYHSTSEDAYDIYRREDNIREIDINLINDGEVFLPSLVAANEPGSNSCDEYERCDEVVCGLELRNVYANGDGELFVRHLASECFIKVVAIDMSSAPECLYRALLHQLEHLSSSAASFGSAGGMREVKLIGYEHLTGDRKSYEVSIPRHKLAVTGNLKRKLRRLRSRDPNIYPLY
jgi:hypothetical protein